MQKTSIEWTDYSWNPVVGCKHGCNYCYARRMNDRFKWIPNWDKPRFFPERLNDEMPSRPSKIFVSSMADLFGDWIPKEWIERILMVVGQNPKHTFQFLTKNPKRYLEFIFPDNCWLGMTLTTGFDDFEQNNFDYFKKVMGYKFVSIEPLLGKITEDLSKIDLVIIGAMTGKNAILPQKEWIKSIQHRNIFFKNNIKQFIK